MAEPHDNAAERIARKLKGRYDPRTSPDVRGRRGRAEVKSTAGEISKALRQLRGGSGPAYVVLPRKEIPKAIRRMRGLKTGIMDYRGNIRKPSTRRRR